MSGSSGLSNLTPEAVLDAATSSSSGGISSDTNNSPLQPQTYAAQASSAVLGAQTAYEDEVGNATQPKGLFDTVSDLVTKAAPLTAAAVVNSFYNTAVEVGNFYGGDFQKATIEKEFGPDSDITNYYQQHAGPIEGVGLALGSLGPGLGAVRALKLAQTGRFGTSMQYATGLASGIRDSAIADATTDLAGNATGTSMFGLTAVNKTKAILAGVADQALQGAVYETATLATMHASPITDNNTLTDDLSDIKDSMLGFGLVGGLIDGAVNVTKINRAVRAADFATKAQEASGALGKGNLTPGDRVVNLYNTLDSIPKPSNKLGEMKFNVTTNTTQRAVREQLIKAAGGDTELAGTFHKFLEEGRQAGTIGPDELVNNLGQLSEIGRHGDTSVVSQPKDVFYIPSKIDPNSVVNATHDELMSKTAFQQGTSKPIQVVRQNWDSGAGSGSGGDLKYVLKMTGEPGLGGQIANYPGTPGAGSSQIIGTHTLANGSKATIVQNGQREINLIAKGADIRGPQPEIDPNKPWLQDSWKKSENTYYIIGTAKKDTTDNSLEHLVVAPSFRKQGIGELLTGLAEKHLGANPLTAADYSADGAGFINNLFNKRNPELANPFALSQAYSLKSPTTLPTIGRATDKFFNYSQPIPGVTPELKYASKEDAFKKGVDIFVANDGSVHPNPTSTAFSVVPRPGESRVLSSSERAEYLKTGNLPPGSKPLNAVGQVLDTLTGKIYGENVLPVVGDLGKPKVVPQGLQVGEMHIFPQSRSLSNDISTLDPMQANARYVWAGLRGSKPSDAIHPTDFPLLEQIYREKLQGITHTGIDTFTDGSSFPKTADDLLQHIADTKQAQYADMLGQGKNADEIGHILNAPTLGLTKNFNTLNPQELMQPLEASSQLRHVRLAYDIGTTRDSEGNLLRGLQATNYRMKLAADTNSNTVANYLASTLGDQKKATGYFSALQFTKGAGDADILGAGAGFLSNANSAYGTIGQQAERIGRAATELSTFRRSVVSDTLSAAANALRNDPQAAAEYGNFVAVRHSTGEHYVLLNDTDAAANKLPANTAVLENALSKDPQTGGYVVNPNYIPNGFQPGTGTSATGLKTYYTLSPKVADLERASQSLNNSRNQLRANWWKSQGISKDVYNPDRLYTPPINTSKYPFMAYVREREGYALGESGASVIVGKDAEDLQKKIALLGPKYDAFTKGDIANFKKAQGEYEFNRNFQTNRVNTELARKGILNNVVPETRAANLINDLAQWHFNQEDLLLRDHIELHNAATFDQLKAMGDRFDQTGISRFGAVTPFMQRSATNPYQSYIKTALGLSPKDTTPLWQLAQEKLQSYGDTAFNIARDALGAVNKGILPAEDAAKLTEKFGLGNPYGTALDEINKSYYGGLANQLPDPNLLSKFVSTANAALGATVIRLDTFQQLIHAVTLPIMTAMEHASAVKDLSKLQDLLTVGVPGTDQKVPGFARTLYNAVRNYFGDSSGELKDMYSQAAGLTKDELQLHRQMIDKLSMPLGTLSKEGWAEKIDNAAQMAEKLSGSKFTNKFIHFVASDVGRQIGEASGQTGQDLMDTIGTFTGRVLGNISAGQRASIFQGPVGNAIGLFQSYQWNMMQQLLRHIGDGDVKALAMGAGMQSSIFGLSSLPGFQALNSMIAQRHGNTQGNDLYSSAAQMTDSKTADYLLYGSLSGLLDTALYSRGDLNPRRASILPVNPLQFPSVAAGIRIYQTLAQLEQNVTTKGGNVPASLLLAAEHNGMSRPLAGLAELVQGFTTSQNGELIDRTSGLGDLSNISNFSRLLGARPLEEGVALDAAYRSNALKTLDSSRLQQLGEAARTAMYNNSPIAPQVAEDFMADYVKAGGNQTNFNQWFLEQSKKANVSSVNQVMENFHNNRSQSLQMQMGGIPLPDFRNTGSTQVSQ